eukprot:Awhi_evm1s5620
MFGLDFLHEKESGRFYILELNGTACGLVRACEEEDMLRMRDLVLAKMKTLFIDTDGERKDIGSVQGTKEGEQSNDMENRKEEKEEEEKALLENIKRVNLEKKELENTIQELERKLPKKSKKGKK